LSVTASSTEEFWGYNLTLTATARDAAGNVIASPPPIQWSSGNTAIATVDTTGAASLLRPGDVTFTATIGSVQGSVAVKVIGFERLARGLSDTACALVEGRRAIYCWGDGGTTANPFIANTAGKFTYTEPVRIAQGDIPGGAQIRKVVLGLFFGCALTEAGTIHCWGDNGRGALGVGGAVAGRPAPTAIAAGAIPAGTVFSDVAASGLAACAVASTGAIYCWGDHGQIPNPALVATTFSPEPVATVAGAIPASVKPLSIALDTNLGCVIGDDGRAYCWQIGNRTPALVPQGDVSAGTKLVAIEIGTDFPCALADSGQIYCWGSGFGRRFGIGNAAFRTQAAPLQVMTGAKPATAKFQTITVGSIAIASCSAADDGRAYCWGGGYMGSLADGDLSTHEGLLPSVVMDGDKDAADTWLKINCARYVCTGLSSDRRIYSWGLNQADALGLPNPLTVAAAVPRRISRPVRP
jgi:alpha-tubulin suppressor-like RCC1 family protein